MDTYATYLLGPDSEAKSASKEAFSGARSKISKYKGLGDKLKMFEEVFGTVVLVVLSQTIDPTVCMDWPMWKVKAIIDIVKKSPSAGTIHQLYNTFGEYVPQLVGPDSGLKLPSGGEFQAIRAVYCQKIFKEFIRQESDFRFLSDCTVSR